MLRKMWVHENRKIIVCVDSYCNGILRGKFFSQHHGEVQFESLSQFLIKMEELLDNDQLPQSYTAPRSFSDMLRSTDDRLIDNAVGAKATFELQILFRQYTSWQGVVVWLEKKAEQSFRSVLELVLLMDSALRDIEGGGSPENDTRVSE